MRPLFISLITFSAFIGAILFIAASILTIRGLRYRSFNPQHVCGFLRPIATYNIFSWSNGPNNSLIFDLYHPSKATREQVEFHPKGPYAIVWKGSSSSSSSKAKDRFMERKEAAFSNGVNLDCHCMNRVAARPSTGDFTKFIYQYFCPEKDAHHGGYKQKKHNHIAAI
jgi:hypothetical protein